MPRAKPFVKWVDGKGQLLEEIRKRYPSQIEKYCEPFVGGGAVLFDVLQTFRPKEVLINDINKELINTYVQVKNNCENLINQLFDLQEKYKNFSQDERKNLFYEKRNHYNELKINENTEEIDDWAKRREYLGKMAKFCSGRLDQIEQVSEKLSYYGADIPLEAMGD